MFKIVDINRVPAPEPEIIEHTGHEHASSTQRDIKIWLRDQYGADIDVIGEQIVEFSVANKQILLNIVGVVLLLLILYSIYRLYRIFADIVEKRRITSIVRKKAE